MPSPEDHPIYGSEILREHGYPEDIIRAVLTHGDHNGIPRESLMEHTLFAVDELSGFIRAVALVRHSKSLDDVTPRSVRRKMKDKNFAKDVNREDIIKGTEELGVDLDDHISFIVESLKPGNPTPDCAPRICEEPSTRGQEPSRYEAFWTRVRLGNIRPLY